jgi:hypothetical protein
VFYAHPMERNFVSGIQICGGQHHNQGYGKALVLDASGLVPCHRGCC